MCQIMSIRSMQEWCILLINVLNCTQFVKVHAAFHQELAILSDGYFPEVMAFENFSILNLSARHLEKYMSWGFESLSADQS